MTPEQLITIVFIIIGIIFIGLTIWGAIEGNKRMKDMTFTSKRDRIFFRIWSILFGSVFLIIYKINDIKIAKDKK